MRLARTAPLTVERLECRLAPAATLASVNAPGTDAGNDRSFLAAADDAERDSSRCLSADGRFVVLETAASNLTTDPVLVNQDNIYVRDLQAGTTTLVNVSVDGRAYGGASDPSITPDGRFVLFTSQAFTGTQALVAGAKFAADAGFTGPQLYVRDLMSQTTTLVTVEPDGTGSVGSSEPYHASISDDGRRVAFMYAGHDDLAPGDSNGQADVIVRDVVANTTVLASRNAAGTDGGNGRSSLPVISGDGSRVVFLSDAGDLTTLTDTNGATDLFAFTMGDGKLQAVDVNAAGTATGNKGVDESFRVDGTGTVVVYASHSTDVTNGNGFGSFDVEVYARNLATNTSKLLSRNASGDPAGGSDDLALGRDGSIAAFRGASGQLFLAETGTNAPVVLASRADDGTQADQAAVAPTLSANGRYLLFYTNATNLVPPGVSLPGPGTDRSTLYVYDRLLERTFPVSTDAAGTQTVSVTGSFGNSFAISRDGKRVAFSPLLAGYGATDTNGSPDVYLADVPQIAPGPLVTGAQFLGSVGHSGTVSVGFEKSVDPASFTTTDVTVTGPNGVANIISVAAVPNTNDTQFVVTFPAQAAGSYTVRVGPDVRDAAGNPMNQDGDATGGEATDDRFTFSEDVAAPTVGALFAVGASDGSVRLVNAATGAVVVSSFRPLDVGASRYAGIVEVAVGDLTGDGTPDLFVAAAGPGGVAGLDMSKAGKVFVYDGAALLGGTTPTDAIHVFTPFANTDGPLGNTGPYVNGLNIAVADVDADGFVNLVAGTRGGTPTQGHPEYGRLVVVVPGTDADGSDDSFLGGAVSPFGTSYQKGVVVAAGDLDGDGKAEVAVTRGGPVAPSNPNRTVKLKAFRFNGANLAELNLSGNSSAFAPFGTITGPGGEVIERDARVAFVDPDGNGKFQLVFSALDRITDPANTQVRIAAFNVNMTTGVATPASTGTGPNGSYLVGSQIVDHAIARTDVNRDGASDLALITETASSGIQYLDPLTGAVRPGGFTLNVLNGGITLDGI
jgi:Tol biopolymer transport system component